MTPDERGGPRPTERPRPAVTSGHRCAESHARLLIEAWGADEASCLTEALTAVVEDFATSARDAPCTETLPLVAGPGPAAELLVSLVEEVIGTLEVFSVVPVRVHLTETEDGGVAGDLEVVPAGRARPARPGPRAVRPENSSMTRDAAGWSCQLEIER